MGKEYPVIEKMNQLAQKYYNTSRPLFCAKTGMVDEIVDLDKVRNYLKAFSGTAYQNAKSIYPQHHMILPRIIKG